MVNLPFFEHFKETGWIHWFLKNRKSNEKFLRCFLKEIYDRFQKNTGKRCYAENCQSPRNLSGKREKPKACPVPPVRAWCNARAVFLWLMIEEYSINVFEKWPRPALQDEGNPSRSENLFGAMSEAIFILFIGSTINIP